MNLRKPILPLRPSLALALLFALSGHGQAANPVDSVTLPPALLRPHFALKTNLLYDLALTPTLEAEIPLNPRWSLNAEFRHGWWLKQSSNFCWQLEALGLEIRHHLGPRNPHLPLTGWFIGLFADAGVYDFQLRTDTGHQGRFYISAGLSGGYTKMFPATPWGIELSVGAGYLTTDYTPYRVIRNELIRNGPDMRFKALLPLKAKLSLLYLIPYPHKKKGGHP
jgi:hypothetical protein